jgi:hypothetical protein
MAQEEAVLLLHIVGMKFDLTHPDVINVSWFGEEDAGVM